MKIQTRRIPFLPPQIDINDLHDNGKLYSDNMIAKIRAECLIHEYPNGRLRSLQLYDKIMRLKYAIIKMDDNYYAIYSGQKKLGSGRYGRVKLAQNLQTGQWLALKVQLDSDVIRSPRSQISRELTNLKKIGRIERIKPTNEPVNFQQYSRTHDERQDYTLMKYSQGNTLDYFIDNKKIYSPIIYLNMSIAFLKAVQRVHQQGLLHRDIKLNNVIYDPIKDHCDLIDFGLSIPKNVFNVRSQKAFIGTLGYVAPELFKQMRHGERLLYTEKVDIYATGIALRQLLNLTNKSALFADKNAYSFFYQPLEKNALYRTNGALLKAFDEFTLKMTDKHPSKRPSLTNAILFFDQLRKTLSIADSTVRVGLVDVRQLETHIENHPENINTITTSFINNAAHYDILWLANPRDDMSTIELMQVSHSFANLGYWVAPVIYLKEPLYHIMNEYNLHAPNQRVPGRVLFSIDEIDWQDSLKNKTKQAKATNG